MKKTVLITGAGTGLGKIASIELAKRGHTVIATTQFENEIDDLKNIAKKLNINLQAFKLDILLEQDRQKISNYDIDVLIANAAIGDTGSISEIEVDRIENTFETNVFSNIKLIQIALKKMINQKHNGRIVILSSLFGRIPYPFFAPYCSTKFAIEAFATCLRSEMKLLNKINNTNIQVVIIEPGAYATGFNINMIDKKYLWMIKDSYFNNYVGNIQSQEKKVFSIIESKNFHSIIKQYIKAVEDKKLKLRYTAPKYQSFFIQLLRIIGY